MRTASDVWYPHDNDTGCRNTLHRERPFGMQVSENTDMITRVHTGRDDQGVMLNRNWGAGIAVKLVDR